MNIYKRKNTEVDECVKKCLPEFKHINHYWDRDRGMVVAKILPGEFYITQEKVGIATTLGSCVSACIWDNRSGIGGMNHFMLPLTTQELHEVDWGQRGLTSDATRYGNFAMEHLINLILKNGGRRFNLRAKIFGGGKVLKGMSDVGERNIEFVLSYLATENIAIEGSNLGEFHPRKVMFFPETGRAFVKVIENMHNDTIVSRETEYSSSLTKDDVSGDVELF
jgi:chemotaxis protein CheD